MFNIFTKQSSGFQDWLMATNGLHMSKHLERGQRPQDYVAIQAHDLNIQPQNHFLIFGDDKVGICGSAAIMAQPSDLKIDEQETPHDMWTLRNVIFHIPIGHPLRQQRDKSKHLAKQFYLTLFEYFWHLTQLSNDRLALSLQQDVDAHKDLASFGGFTFVSKMMAEHQDAPMAIGIILLTEKAYETFTRHKKSFDKSNDGLLRQMQPAPFSHFEKIQERSPKIF